MFYTVDACSGRGTDSGIVLCVGGPFVTDEYVFSFLNKNDVPHHLLVNKVVCMIIPCKQIVCNMIFSQSHKIAKIWCALLAHHVVW